MLSMKRPPALGKRLEPKPQITGMERPGMIRSGNIRIKYIIIMVLLISAFQTAFKHKPHTVLDHRHVRSRSQGTHLRDAFLHLFPAALYIVLRETACRLPDICFRILLRKGKPKFRGRIAGKDRYLHALIPANLQHRIPNTEFTVYNRCEKAMEGIVLFQQDARVHSSSLLQRGDPCKFKKLPALVFGRLHRAYHPYPKPRTGIVQGAAVYDRPLEQPFTLGRCQMHHHAAAACRLYTARLE